MVLDTTHHSVIQSVDLIGVKSGICRHTFIMLVAIDESHVCIVKGLLVATILTSLVHHDSFWRLVSVRLTSAIRTIAR